MTPRPGPAAVPTAAPGRTGRARDRRASGPPSPGGRFRSGGAVAFAVVALGLLGGAGTVALVPPATGPGGDAVRMVQGPVAPPVGAPTDDLPGAAPDDAGEAVAARSTTRGAPPARADDAAGTVAGGGTPTATGTAALDAAAADVRPLPLPRLVPRDTVGPLWLTPADRAAGLLALDVPEAASGVLDVVPGSVPAPGTVGVRSVRVEVERGLPVDGAVFAATVMATLNAPHGWGARGDVSFARTDGPADVRVVLASPALVDALCAPLGTAGQYSCGRNGHAALNFRRWVHATDEFADRTLYRQYLVNHEVGHLLGHPHERCPGAGQPAPLMQQQSVRVAPCLPNGWPYP